MRKILVTVTNYDKFCGLGLEMLREKGYELLLSDRSRPYTEEELLGVVSDIDAVVCGVDNWNEKVINAAEKLKIIARFGVGTDNINIPSATQKGVVVTNVLGVNSASVAEHTCALLFAALRKIPYLDSGVKEGKWERVMFSELRGKTIGFIGFGSIAQKVAACLSGFNISFKAFDINGNTKAAEKLNVEMVNNIETIYRDSHIISLHIPLTPNTENIINKNSIALMKNGVILINTARGALWSEGDIAQAVKSGKIAAVATDVYQSEPISNNCPLIELDNAILTPHVAGESYENYSQSSVVTAQAIIDVLEGKVPINALNQVKYSRELKPVITNIKQNRA